MVYFVCEGCNETLKKNQVAKHSYSCRHCEAVTCVDCSVTFYGNDYEKHITCISEAEKYEKSLYKKPQEKPKAQDLWNTLIEEICSFSDKASSIVRPYLQRLSSLNNVPRNKKKFINFAKNSLNIRQESVLEDIWNFIEVCKNLQEQQSNTVEETPAPAAQPVSNNNDDKQNKKRKADDAQLQTDSTNDNSDSKEKKSKKNKKDKQEEEPEVVVETVVTPVEEGEKKKKSKKDKKDKNEAKEEVETPAPEPEKKDKKEKKKKDKKE